MHFRGIAAPRMRTLRFGLGLLFLGTARLGSGGVRCGFASLAGERAHLARSGLRGRVPKVRGCFARCVVALLAYGDPLVFQCGEGLAGGGAAESGG